MIRLRHAALAALVAYGSSSCSHWYGQTAGYTAAGAVLGAGAGAPIYLTGGWNEQQYGEFVVASAAAFFLFAIPYTLWERHEEHQAHPELYARDDWEPSSSDPCERCLQTCDHQQGRCFDRCGTDENGDRDTSCDFRCEQGNTECENHCDGIYTSDQGHRVCIPASSGAEPEQPASTPAPAPIQDVTMCGDAPSSEQTLSGNVVSNTFTGYAQYSAAEACATAKAVAFNSLKGLPRYTLEKYVIYAPCCACHREPTDWRCTTTASAVESVDGDTVYASFGAGTGTSDAGARQVARNNAEIGCSGKVADVRDFGCMSDTNVLIGGAAWACFAAATCNY